MAGWSTGIILKDNFITGMGLAQGQEFSMMQYFQESMALTKIFLIIFKCSYQEGIFNLFNYLLFYNLSKNSFTNFSKSDFYTFLLPLFLFLCSMDQWKILISQLRFIFLVVFSGIKFKDKL